MNKLLSVAALLALLQPLPAIARQSNGAASASPLEALGAYLGQWSGDGRMLDTAYSKAADIGAITDCSWSPSHGFLICDQKIHTPAGPSEDVSIYTYNEKDHEYEFFGLSRNSREVRTPKLTIQGNRWIYSSQFTDQGKHVQFRTTNDFTSATTLTFKTEFSLDGTHWTLMLAGTSHRVK
ncbi:MAG: hypothetical protein ACRD3T_04935 [Terriglobia bacterium]